MAMTSDALLRGKIFAITRGDLEGARFATPQVGPFIDSMTFVRITRLSRFWKQWESEDQMLLTHSMEDLVAGFYGQLCSWMFILKGSPKQIECWFGVHQNGVEKPTLHSILSSAFPDVRCNDVGNFAKSSLERMRYALILTGTPSPKIDQKQVARVDQIEKICRGLYGYHWAYVVCAQPIQAIEITKSLNDIAEEIQNVHATHLLKTSAIDEQNRMAKRYVDLLEAKLKRLEQGQTSGMWAAHVILFADHASSLGRGKGLLHSAFSGEKSIPDSIRACLCSAEVRQSPALEPRNGLEVALMSRLPMEEYPGYEVVDYARFGVETNNLISSKAKSIMIGEIFDRGVNTGNALHISLHDLTKHGLIVGVTGSGKTNTCFTLLDQIWDSGRGVPFLVIESAKSEYRSLLRNPRFKGLHVFTVGDETISPLRLNPFEVPKGILTQTHIDYLKSLFSAAFVLYPPMPYVLEQSLQEIYEDRGWDLARNTNSRGADSARLFPTLSDLAAKIGVVVDRMGYDERITMDVKAGLLARINQLRLGGGKGLMLNSRKSLPASVLFGSPCLLELKQIVSDDEKAFIIGLILIRLYEHHEGQSNSGRGYLRHITLIEEAHRLLRNVSTEQNSETTANPKGRAIEVFANILSEIRAYGEGILIAEQVPTKLTPDAIKNTNLKIVHRLVAEDDRKAVGSTMNLGEPQMRYLTTLRSGEGIVYTEGMQKPVFINVALSSMKKVEKELTISAQEIRGAMSFFSQQYHDLTMPFPGCTRCPAIVVGKDCGARDEVHTRDMLAIDAFKRLFNALRLNDALLFKAYAEFDSLCQCHPARRQETYCLFVEMIEAEIERRGEFWGWSYQDVEKAIDLSCSVVSGLASHWSKAESGSLSKEISQELAALANLFDRLHALDVLPYAGCRFCAAPCHYRFDMTYPNDDQNVKDFRTAFLNPQIKMDEVVRICLDSSMRTFFSKDMKSGRGAALCFAVQQFRALGLSRADQKEMTQQVVDTLST